ncbi:hypothetical protein vseg_010808 [Gypsophila vaccaria]
MKFSSMSRSAKNSLTVCQSVERWTCLCLCLCLCLCQCSSAFFRDDCFWRNSAHPLDENEVQHWKHIHLLVIEPLRVFRSLTLL